MVNGKHKGGQYEREICRELSLWFSRGKSDDLFWRSAGSGSRATLRGRKGKTTKGHGGDIAPTSAEGEYLTNLCAIEIKRGYSSNTLMDLLDRTDHSKIQLFEDWIWQAIQSQRNTMAFYWMLITRRDKHQALIHFPTKLYYQLERGGCNFKTKAVFKVSCRRQVGRKKGQKLVKFVSMGFDEFLTRVPPIVIRNIHDDCQRWRKGAKQAGFA